MKAAFTHIIALIALMSIPDVGKGRSSNAIRLLFLDFFYKVQMRKLFFDALQPCLKCAVNAIVAFLTRLGCVSIEVYGGGCKVANTS